jgi:pimeloyl-ACP methyl ester carboxylesterase
MNSRFVVGYRDLHPNAAVNFQLNRWISYLGEDALAEIGPVLPKLTDLPSLRREFLSLADKAEARGRLGHAAYYCRAAEFFMFADDPGKAPVRQRFLDLIWKAHGLTATDRQLVPYTDGQQQGLLPAYRFPATGQQRGTIVVHGGGDSYIEEFFPLLPVFTDAGYEVVAFEGPGQGGALEESGLPMTAEWHKPTAAILDHFGLEDVTMIGVSMGGCLVLRAAAAEPRITRVIAYDVLYDNFGMWLAKLAPPARALMRGLVEAKAGPVIDALIYRAAGKSVGLEWAIRQGMHLTGTRSPYEYLRAIGRFTTRGISPQVTQHVLIMAGAEDWSVPVSQYYQQLGALTSARSVTGRLFSRAEHAHQHCQVGNLGLALDYMLDWIAFHTAEDQRQPARMGGGNDDSCT